MSNLILMMLSSLLAALRSQAALQSEILARRHQLIVLQRTQKKKRLILHAADRWLWVWLSRLWSAWRSALVIVKPATVVAWHRQGFGWYYLEGSSRSNRTSQYLKRTSGSDPIYKSR